MKRFIKLFFQVEKKKRKKMKKEKRTENIPLHFVG